ncbi:MAG: hypothetical protein RLY31_1261 [Bacteroidota bacterium]|jgi:ABC-2 type transport system permease protein
MNTLRHLLLKEFRQIFRNPAILRMILVMPVVQLLVFPLAADYEVRNIRLAVVDQDGSDYSQTLRSRIAASGYFKAVYVGPVFEEGFRLLERDGVDLVLEVPAGFERSMVREQAGSLAVSMHAVNGARAAVGGVYLGRILAAFNREIRSEWQFPSVGRGEGISVSVRYWYNRFMNYRIFMVPAILAILVTMVGVYMCSLNIVKEKEVGTIEQINVSPVRKYQFILGKLLPFWLIGVFVFTLGLLLVARLIYGIVPAGSLALLYAYLGLYLVAVLGIGLLISTYSNTQQQAMSLAFFSTMIFILMSGLFTPVESMPGWAQGMARLNPVTYFIEVMRLVVVKGSTFADIRRHFAVMAVFAVVINAWAVLHYRKTS